jgi:sulfhydrogenase subunit beta (sulfur reductase)
MEIKSISKDSLVKLFDGLKSQGKLIFAPVKINNEVQFDFVDNFNQITDDFIQTTQSVKNTVFPKIETLFKFVKNGKDVRMMDIDLSQLPEIVIWGAHPCDALGFDSLRAIFTWDSHDVFFEKRMEKLTIIGMSCAKADNYCFCTSVNLSPGNTKGSDILLTKTTNGDYVAELITEKGKSVAESVQGVFNDAVQAIKEDFLAKVEERFDTESLIPKMQKKETFDSPFWIENSLRCIGCGACAFVCPTCACFDIQDEGYGAKNIRFRNWDSCGLKLFTLHTSGHNPREVQSQRWRQRLMHKFAYMPERNKITGCVGCGRCSRACPTDMNIAEQLQEINQKFLI